MVSPQQQVQLAPGHIPPALAKRVKRHVVGKQKTFFIVTGPGLEDLSMEEVRSVLPMPEKIQTVTGGVEFTGRLTDGYSANLHLHTANRVLMRLYSFRAEHFKQLEDTVGGFPWELYLFKGSALRFHVSAEKSKLYHKAAIAERFRSAINRRLDPAGVSAASGAGRDAEQQIFVRALRDRFTVSIDSSGELLYRRGIKAHPGQAPLRETLAAAVLKLSGYRPGALLVDPMCGTGSFALEAAMMAKRIPPGWFREFAFIGWPAFKPRQWDYLKRAAGDRIVQTDRPVVFASDRDPGLVQQLQQCVSAYRLSDAADVSCRDFFGFSPREFTDRTGLVVLNPPFGHRMETPRGRRDLFGAIWEKLHADYRGWRFAVLSPERGRSPLPVQSFRLFHGGLKLWLLTGEIM